MLGHIRLHQGECVENPHRLLVLSAGVQDLAEHSQGARMMLVSAEHLQTAGFRGREAVAGEILPRQKQ